MEHSSRKREYLSITSRNSLFKGWPRPSGLPCLEAEQTPAAWDSPGLWRRAEQGLRWEHQGTSAAVASRHRGQASIWAAKATQSSVEWMNKKKRLKWIVDNEKNLDWGMGFGVIFQFVILFNIIYAFLIYSEKACSMINIIHWILEI